MSSLLRHIADRALNRPLMLLPDKLAIISHILSGRIGIDAEALAPGASSFAGVARQGQRYRVTEGGVAIIPVIGSLVNRGAWIGAQSGLVSYEGIAQQLEAAARDPKVKFILLDFESPGGEAVGAMETAALVRKIGAEKPVHSLVNGMAASAAYAIASASKSIVSTPSAVSGSIGVVLLHTDVSRALDKAGVTPSLVFAGAHKTDGNSYQPLSKSVRQDLQAEVDKYYDLFLSTVAAGRGQRMDAKAARATQARTYIGSDAKAAGLVDDLGSFSELLSELERTASKPASAISLSSTRKKPVSTGEYSAGFSAGWNAQKERIKAIIALPEAARNPEASRRRRSIQISASSRSAPSSRLPAGPARHRRAVLRPGTTSSTNSTQNVALRAIVAKRGLYPCR